MWQLFCNRLGCEGPQLVEQFRLYQIPTITTCSSGSTPCGPKINDSIGKNQNAGKSGRIPGVGALQLPLVWYTLFTTHHPNLHCVPFNNARRLVVLRVRPNQLFHPIVFTTTITFWVQIVYFYVHIHSASMFS